MDCKNHLPYDFFEKQREISTLNLFCFVYLDSLPKIDLRNKRAKVFQRSQLCLSCGLESDQKRPFLRNFKNVE